VPIVRAEGAYLFDADGRPILDAISSWWVTTHGHAHPEIATAIADQAGRLEQVIFAGFTHEPAAMLAAELVRVLPSGLEKIFFSDDGSTAVEVSVKMALQYWANRGTPRPLVAALTNAYHGDTFGAMSLSGRGVFTKPFDAHLFEVARLPDPTEGDVVSAFAALIDTRGSELAALVVEPLLLGAGGMRVWEPSALRGLHDLAKAAGVLLIADEVLTGFGRTGPLFASGGAGITPDIVCLSKGLTGGFLPLGVTGCTNEIFEGFLSGDRTKTLFHGHSFTANPIACAAARASLALFTEECDVRRREIERVHVSQLDELRNLPVVRRPRVLGTVAAFDFGQEDADYLNPIGPRLGAYALDRGVLLRPLGNTVYILPPYCITASELVRIYEVIRTFAEGA